MSTRWNKTQVQDGRIGSFRVHALRQSEVGSEWAGRTNQRTRSASYDDKRDQEPLNNNGALRAPRRRGVQKTFSVSRSMWEQPTDYGQVNS